MKTLLDIITKGGVIPHYLRMNSVYGKTARSIKVKTNLEKDAERVQAIKAIVVKRLAKQGLVPLDWQLAIVEVLAAAIIETTPCTCEQRGQLSIAIGCQVHMDRQ